jgi:glutathione S-transferase
MSRGSKRSGANAARGLVPAAFSYGAFGAADAMYAPIVWRIHTYSVEVSVAARDYTRTLMALPAWREWRGAARREPWVLPHDEVDWPEVKREELGSAT